MRCFARLVKVLLGEGAVSESKLDVGAALEILGVQLVLTDRGYTAMPSKRTIKKCLRAIEKALSEGSLPCGAAQKLTGRLNWAGQYLFHRLGRAMLRPLYDQKGSKCAFAVFFKIRLRNGWGTFICLPAGMVRSRQPCGKHCCGGKLCSSMT